TPTLKDEARNPNLSIDLVCNRDFGGVTGSNDNLTFTLTDSSGAVSAVRGGLVSHLQPNAEDVGFVLERRLDPNRAEPLLTLPLQSADNPWVEVDRFTFEQNKIITYLPSDTTLNVQSQLATLVSRERVRPLDRNLVSDFNQARLAPPLPPYGAYSYNS